MKPASIAVVWPMLETAPMAFEGRYRWCSACFTGKEDVALNLSLTRKTNPV